MKRPMLISIFFCSGFVCGLLSCNSNEDSLQNRKIALGKRIFQDTTLSEPVGQACATCHTITKGFADRESRMVSEGAVRGLYSQRNAMTVCYSAYVPPLSFDNDEGTYVGGLFWDGRSVSLQSQAGEPFLNPVEMGNPDTCFVVEKICHAPYYAELIKIYGKTSNKDSLYTYITDALAAYQQSDEVNPFSSKYDAWEDGKYTFTDSECRGMELFKDKAMCAECHILDKDERAGRVLFTDHTYDNLGIPRNLENPHLRIPADYFLLTPDSVDLGLGSVVGREEENGKFRVPTLRNIALTAPYGHNGYFKTLEEIVHFYNVRDVGNEFPPAEYPATINRDELGNLGLTSEEEADLIAFMKTLTDDFKPVQK